MRVGQGRFVALFLAPALALYGLFALVPYAQGAAASLTAWGGYSGRRRFVGLDNYARLVGDERFWSALGHNAVVLAVLPPVTVGLAVALAALTTVAGGRSGRVGPIRGAGAYRAVFLLPNVLPLVMGLVLWHFALHPRVGLLNGLLDAVGLEGWSRAWLGDPATARWAVLGVLVWGQVGFAATLLAAALDGLPRECLEAATLDGAGRWRTLRFVALPMTARTVRVVWVYLATLALDLFVVVAVLTPDGGPSGSTEVMATYLQRLAFGAGRFGDAAAIGVVLTLLSLLVAAAALLLARRERAER
ncbi:carbohydrate ABC transporter permease [Xylanimonas ulmi]|uniref:N-acetylglucosamine transport system permease protein n=1 Tax=Xylanimonas ulmi TaxID=228973 RepID=A0A4Q7M3L0_9MICO|nr:sugar ABC transporter permease [Xylanibacterium ulmi]RZS61921.1 N-acetylglucosamine transport system permease protein [Xylanibacterium ulmi]